MFHITGNPITFYFHYTASSAGKTGLAVTVNVYKNGVLLSGMPAAATHLATGVYYYTLAAASVDVSGEYIAIASTTDVTVDQKNILSICRVFGSLDLTETESGQGIPLSLSGLRWQLRVILNDIAADGSIGNNYRTAQLDLFLNLAYRDTMLVTKCHKMTKSVALVAGQHTYDCEELFEPVEVALSEVGLHHEFFGQRTVTLESWNNDPAGIPAQWMHVSGGNIRVHPTPSAASLGVVTAIAAAPTAGGTGYAVGDTMEITTGGSDAIVEVTAVNAGVVTAVKLTAGGSGYTTGAGKATTAVTGSGVSCTINISTIGALTIHGYGHADAMTDDDDTPDGLPDAHAAAAILSRACWYARAARGAVANNLAFRKDDDRDWQVACQSIRDSIKAGS